MTDEKRKAFIVGITRAGHDDLRGLGVDVDLVNRTLTRVNGMPTRIVDEATAEACALVICGAPPPANRDDIHTVCYDCGAAIVHRPHAPTRPIKVCHPCGLRRIAEYRP